MFLVTCYRPETGAYREARVPVGEDVGVTLERLGRELAGPGFETGLFEAELCVWDMEYPFTGRETFYPCRDWDERYSEAAAGAAEGDDGSFEEGRVVHHVPNEMVLDQTYFLELAIQPLTASTTVAQADETLREAVGTGLAPGADGDLLGLEFSTVRASELMSAGLVGAGYEITPISDELQPLFGGEATVWQWQVIPRETGVPNLTFSLNQALVVAGREVNRSVKTIPLTVRVRSIDELLANADLDAPVDINESVTTASRSVDLVAADGTAVTPAVAEGGCTTLAGSDPERHALLVTNLAYISPISRLEETHLDGERLGAALNMAGFAVTHCRDLGQREVIRALSTLGQTAKGRTDAGDKVTTFFYYSGHGAHVDGTNYVLPVDLDGAGTVDIRDGGVTFEDIFNRVSSTVATTSFIVFDACRTVMDDESRGLVREYRPVGWPTGVFQAFATAPGDVAADSGLYSSVLAELMETVPEPANVLFKRVQDRVTERTEARQRPVYTDATTGGDFYFMPAGGE